MSSFVNDVKFVSTTSGLSDFGVPATAVSGFQLPAVAADFATATYSYSARTTTGEFESGTGVCDGSTQARTVPIDGSDGPGNKVNFSVEPTVIITVLASDMVAASAGRTLLTADATYYVGPSGTLTNGGSGYVDGFYGSVSLTGGGGSGYTADIAVDGGIVVFVGIISAGSGYSPGDVLSANNADLGGSGSGFLFTVGQTASDTPTSGTSDQPFATLQYAWEQLSGSLDLGEFNLSILLGPGTYTLVAANGWIGGKTVTIDSEFATINDLSFGLAGSFTMGPGISVSDNILLVDNGSGYCCYCNFIGSISAAKSVAPNFSAATHYIAHGCIFYAEGFDNSSGNPTTRYIWADGGFVFNNTIFATSVNSSGVFDAVLVASNGGVIALVNTVSFGGSIGGSTAYKATSNGVIKIGASGDSTGTAVYGNPGVATEGGRYIGYEAVPIANLPSSVPVGERQTVSDALAPVFGSPVASGGAIVVGVIWDGANWNVG